MNTFGRTCVTKPSLPMSGLSNKSGLSPRPVQALTAEEHAAEDADRRRARLERFWQGAIFVFIVGAGQLSARTGGADPFFFGQPSAVIATICLWATRGTPHGP